MNALIVSSKGREQRLAVIKSGTVDQIHIFQPSHLSRVGFIYYGVVTKVEKGMDACFVDIGLERKGYLHRSDWPNHQNRSISELVHQGQKVIVQVTKDASEMKGARLSAVIEWPGKRLVYLPQGGYTAVSKKVANEGQRREWINWIEEQKSEGEGVILRTAAFQQSKEEFLAEWEKLREEHKNLLQKARQEKAPALLIERELLKETVFTRMQELQEGELVCDEAKVLSDIKKDPRFESKRWSPVLYTGREEVFAAYQVPDALQTALKQVVWLPSGGFIVIQRTEAMTVIDVNTGKFTGKSSQRQTVLLINKEAAIESLRQARLRDISGIILIDFIDMFSEEDRRKVEALLVQEAKKDVKQLSIRGFTALGLMEITRKKTKTSLLETLTVPCQTCGGTGRMVSPETAAFRLEREVLAYERSSEEAILIEATPEVIEIFAGEQREYHNKLEALISKRMIYRVIQSDIPRGRVVRAGSSKELESNQLEKRS
ncbi:Rne/Rng family ribonuclease [Bacillus thermotolerans]|uniref:Rne/Rng family ribonuclease n=1 Tax=Bacillus thermotolerans TaxID=1221996 RepID=UPI0005809F11|nr:Rne/Rng family ribonuclease [Bacillus thermotolerans]KKB35088.1 Cytoplasmic axial filament protein CafA and Ribonuclease G [Bacillus thermotolerans]